MRFLLDTYIQADASETVADFEDTGLVELIVQLGAGAIDKLPAGIKADPEAVAETIANNMRKVIIDERAMNPKYYDRMSELLDALIEEKRRERDRLQGVPGEADRAGAADSASRSPTRPTRPGPTTAPSARCIDFGLPGEELALDVDRSDPAHQARPVDRQHLQGAEGPARRLANVLPPGYDRLDELMELVKARDEYR